jgi:hypothetical protein
LQLVDRNGLLRATNVTEEWSNNIPGGAGLQGRYQWNIGRELDSIGVDTQVQVGPEFQRGRKGRHAGGAKYHAIEPAGHGQGLWARVPQFVSGGIDD